MEGTTDYNLLLDITVTMKGDRFIEDDNEGGNKLV